MKLMNSENQYGLIAILFHWVMALIMIGLIAIGLYMTWIPLSLTKIKLFGWHKEYGFLILGLAILRMGWRIATMTPNLPAYLPQWQKQSALTVHWLFYVLMFTLPLTGWLITSAAGFPVSFFGWFLIPNLIEPDEERRMLFTELHKWLSYGLIAILCLHMAAAFKHHFINKDDVLRRML